MAGLWATAPVSQNVTTVNLTNCSTTMWQLLQLSQYSSCNLQVVEYGNFNLLMTQLWKSNIEDIKASLTHSERNTASLLLMVQAKLTGSPCLNHDDKTDNVFRS